MLYSILVDYMGCLCPSLGVFVLFSLLVIAGWVAAVSYFYLYQTK